MRPRDKQKSVQPSVDAVMVFKSKYRLPFLVSLTILLLLLAYILLILKMIDLSLLILTTVSASSTVVYGIRFINERESTHKSVGTTSSSTATAFGVVLKIIVASILTWIALLVVMISAYTSRG